MEMVVLAYSLVAPPLPGEQVGVEVLLRQLISSGERINTHSRGGGGGSLPDQQCMY